MSTWSTFITLTLCVTVLGSVAIAQQRANPPAASASAQRVYELRTYTAAPGKFEALKARFRDHTLRLFAKHNMNAPFGYWTPSEGSAVGNTLVYVLVHPSREAARQNWAAFAADPEWVKAKAESEMDGPLVARPAESVFLTAADFSPIK